MLEILLGFWWLIFDITLQRQSIPMCSLVNAHMYSSQKMIYILPGRNGELYYEKKPGQGERLKKMMMYLFQQMIIQGDQFPAAPLSTLQRSQTRSVLLS